MNLLHQVFVALNADHVEMKSGLSTVVTAKTQHKDQTGALKVLKAGIEQKRPGSPPARKRFWRPQGSMAPERKASFMNSGLPLQADIGQKVVVQTAQRDA